METRKSYLWNTIASMLNAALSAILLLAVMRLLGPEEGGIFSLGFSIAQLMLTIGFYDMRVYHATDVSTKYSFGEFFNSRVITCALMMIISLVYVLIKGYEGEKFLIIILLCVFKMSDAIEDVYQGEMQRIGHLAKAGFLQTVRLITCIALFTATLLLTRDLLISSFITTVAAVMLAIIMNHPSLRKLEDFSLRGINYKNVVMLLITCLPLCVGSYLALYVGNAPKYAIDTYMNDIYQSYYNVLFMPSYVINLLSGFILRPSLTNLALNWMNNDRKLFLKKIAKLSILTVALTLIVSFVAYLCGCQILGFVYGVDIMEHRISLVILMFGGGFYALGMIIYYAVTIIRKQKFLMIIYVIVAVIAFIISPGLVKNIGIFGASMTYFVSTVIRFIGFAIVFAVFLKKIEKGNVVSNE